MPKPKWFYEYIGTVAKTDVSAALHAWDAELIDKVHANVHIKRDYEEVHSLYEGFLGVVAGQTELTITLTDQSLPVDTRLGPIKFIARPDSLLTWGIEMNAREKGQYRALLLFQGMYVDRPQVHFDMTRHGYRHKYIHLGQWEPDDNWYFVYPNMLEMRS
jgi:hypothetical protein